MDIVLGSSLRKLQKGNTGVMCGAPPTLLESLSSSSSLGKPKHQMKTQSNAMAPPCPKAPNDQHNLIPFAPASHPEAIWNVLLPPGLIHCRTG